MSWDWTLPGLWLLRTALGGGLLLLFVWVVVSRVRQPVRRQRLAEWGVLAALLLAVLGLLPSWLPVVQLPAAQEPAVALVRPDDAVPSAQPEPPAASEEAAHPEHDAPVWLLQGGPFADPVLVEGENERTHPLMADDHPTGPLPTETIPPA